MLAITRARIASWSFSPKPCQTPSVMPTPTRPTRRPMIAVEDCLWPLKSVSIASSVNMGVVALRIAARMLVVNCWANAYIVKGNADIKNPATHKWPHCFSFEGSEIFRAKPIASIAAAPSAVLQKATPRAVVSSSESSMNKKLEPQIRAIGMNLNTQWLSKLVGLYLRTVPGPKGVVAALGIDALVGVSTEEVSLALYQSSR